MSTDHGMIPVTKAIDAPLATFNGYDVEQRNTNSRRTVAEATKFFKALLNIFGSSIQNSLHVSLLVPRIEKQLIEFFENLCNPHVQNHAGQASPIRTPFTH
jgi:hypothetical protein